MDKKRLFRKNHDIVSRQIDDETILIPVFKSSDEINCIYSLNKAAAIIWEMIDGKRTLAEIKEEILKRFDTTQEEVDKETEKFLKDSLEIKAIE